ncbi:uncharacterized protein LOC110266099 [Arachis ipaensis]|uniref:uncharacterized protein LOC110266099 n=1 Tax=Arachis ipaensis TaxID=130454 RepID=UPI000A2B08F5|nr:uncharacterized protein LOC110266099 [Arachis ipaensis]
METMIPVEVDERFLRVIFYNEDTNSQAQKEELNLLPEVRERARIREEALKHRITSRYNRKAPHPISPNSHTQHKHNTKTHAQQEKGKNGEGKKGKERGKLESESKKRRGGRGRTALAGITAAAPSCRRQEGGDVEREEELRKEGEPLCLHRRCQFAFFCHRGKPPLSSSSSRAGCCQLPPPSHLPSRTTLRTHRRDRRVEIGRRRKKEEALFALLRPVAVRGVTVVGAVRGCFTEPLSPENSAASPGFTTGGKGKLKGVEEQLRLLRSSVVITKKFSATKMDACGSRIEPYSYLHIYNKDFPSGICLS